VSIRLESSAVPIIGSVELGGNWDLMLLQDFAPLLFGAVGAKFRPVVAGAIAVALLSASQLVLDRVTVTTLFGVSFGEFPVQLLLTPVSLFIIGRFWASTPAGGVPSRPLPALLVLLVSCLLAVTSCVRGTVAFAAVAYNVAELC